MTAIKISTGKIILSFLSLFTSISPYLADWNITHIYNPDWTPHAKFHNAQTMILGTFLGILTVYCVWFRNSISSKQKLNEAATLVSLYWLAQLPDILFTGMLLQYPGIHHAGFPKIFGVEFNQLTMDITVLLPLILSAFYLENKKLKTASNN